MGEEFGKRLNIEAKKLIKAAKVIDVSNFDRKNNKRSQWLI